MKEDIADRMPVQHLEFCQRFAKVRVKYPDPVILFQEKEKKEGSK